MRRKSSRHVLNRALSNIKPMTLLIRRGAWLLLITTAIFAQAQSSVSTGTNTGIPPRPITIRPIPIAKPLPSLLAARKASYLAVNAGSQLAGTGKYRVTLRLSRAAAVVTTASPVNLEQAVTPELMAALPRRVSDQQGDLGDVVNFAVLGTAAQVQKAFAAAGWVAVDRTTDDAVVHGLLATLSKQAYLAMPMSILYLYGRPQDMSYARADPLTVAMVRHHLRLWNSGLTVAGRPLWVGAATHDNGLERDRRTNGWTHRIDPNIDVERDFIEQSFAAAGVLGGAVYVTPADPVRNASTATGESYRTDGRVLMMVLD